MSAWFRTPDGGVWNAESYTGFFAKEVRGRLNVYGMLPSGKPSLIYVATDQEEAQVLLNSIAGTMGGAYLVL
jgi:hypothetical protein